MTVKVLYKTQAKANGGRDGRSELLDGSFGVTLATPKELGGNGNGHNPEQLFAMGYAACYLGAMKYVASQEKLATLGSDATVTSTVGIGPRDDGGFGLEVQLEVNLPGVPLEVAETIAQKAHHVCPYSHATHGNISVKTTVV